MSHKIAAKMSGFTPSDDKMWTLVLTSAAYAESNVDIASYHRELGVLDTFSMQPSEKYDADSRNQMDRGTKCMLSV